MRLASDPRPACRDCGLSGYIITFLSASIFNIARTMGMVTFALFLLFFSMESKDERDPAFSLDIFSGTTFLITTSVSFVLLVPSTVPGIFQTVMTITRLDVRQWLICTAAALSIVAAAEIRKAMRRQAAAT